MDALLPYWLKIKKHLTKVMMGLFALLTVAVGYFYLQEQSVPEPPIETMRIWKPEKIVGAETEDFLTTYTAPSRAIHDSSLAILTVISVWEQREGTTAEELQKQALQLYQGAQSARQQGNLTQARRDLIKALSIVPNYKEAEALLEEVEKELAAAP